MKAQTQQKLRRYHLYIGMFLAPAIIFFALSGALQTFRLQEEKGWGGSAPPEWIVWISSVHIDDRLPQPKAAAALADEHADHEEPAAKPAAPKPATPPPPSALPFKIFAVIMSVGLILSAMLGIFIALNNRATRRVSTIMLAAGVVLPLLLLKI